MQPCLVDLFDPTTFSRGNLHERFAQLRKEGTVHRHPEPDGPGFWVATRYRDVQAVYSDPETFSSRSGMRLGSSAAAVAGVADRQLVVSDPPQHTRVRRVANEAFTPRRLRRLVEPVTAAVDELVVAHLSSGGGDFVAAVAEPLPVHVICAMMDLPRQDWDSIRAWTTAGMDSEDPRERLAANAEIFLYFADLVDFRRREPGDDLVSILVTTPKEGFAPLTDEEVVVNCNGILVGAIETLRYAAAGGVHAFAWNTEAWAEVKEGRAAVATAAEEILRWTAPGLHAMRTVTRPTELSGVDLTAGDRITIWNCSANRDEDVFPAPDTFRPTRSPNHHVTFGLGPHTCIGSRLARIELAALLESLRARVETIVPIGEATWSPSNFIHGLTSLPVRFA
jgi:cytochrome P450